VYGEPALVGTIDLGVRVRVFEGSLTRELKANKFVRMLLSTFAEEMRVKVGNLNLEIAADLPRKSGLGSSTALATALFRGLVKWYGVEISNDRLFELVMAAERKTYPTVSGMDQTAIVYEGVYEFVKRERDYVKKKLDEKLIEKVELLLVNSGQPEETTAEMVGLVRGRLEDGGEEYKKIIEEMGEVSRRVVQKGLRGKWDKTLVSRNQRLLERLGVVGEKAKVMVREIERVGGVAKISGAGGIKRGSGVLVVMHDDLTKMEKLSKRNNWRYWKVRLG